MLDQLLEIFKSIKHFFLLLPPGPHISHVKEHTNKPKKKTQIKQISIPENGM